MFFIVDSHAFNVSQPILTNLDFALILLAHVDKCLLFADRVRAKENFRWFVLSDDFGNEFERIGLIIKVNIYSRREHEDRITERIIQKQLLYRVFTPEYHRLSRTILFLPLTLLFIKQPRQTLSHLLIEPHITSMQIVLVFIIE